MAKYRCIICGYIYDDDKEKIKFNDLDDSWTCPLCGVGKDKFEIVEEMDNDKREEIIDSNTTNYNAVTIFEDNPCIERINGCINCGICRRTCLQREKMRGDENCLICVGCGQCIMTCPKNVLQPRSDIHKFIEAKDSGKICIAYTSPGVRVSIGDEFGYESGEYLENKLVGVLREIGFDYVFDVTFGADLTIMEEASELIERINNKGKLPMITSCCPAWVRYAEIFYPEILDNLSTCKSPIGMQGMMVKKYFAKLKNINEEDIFTVAITPCTAKKGEISRDNIDGTDCVITVNEMSTYLKGLEIDFNLVSPSEFDSVLSRGSGAGVIFANTGGVMEAALRTANYMITGNKMNDLDIVNLRGYNGLKEYSIKIGGIELNIAVIDEMANAIPVLDSIKNNTCKYDFIEIMNCRGGCIGGGGQPKYMVNKEDDIKNKRIDSIYNKDLDSKYRCSYENPDIIKIYDEFLGKPLSDKAHELLHTTYKDKSNILNEKKN